MATIRIEAELSAEQLLRAVEQLSPAEFSAFFARLLDRARREASLVSEHADNILEQQEEKNPYLAAAGMFEDDSFAAEVDAYIAAQRERERAAASREAGA
jgi:hypothetical protein